MWLLYNKSIPIILSHDNAVLHFMYPYAIITQYIVTIITLNSSLKYSENKKNKIFYFTFLLFLL